MPTYTYPGVYIQEIPSGVHTITGVATSIAAFVGWAAQGPTNQATLVQSWSDFANQFGGLDSRSYLGYAVNQFFANGGQQAYIIRLVSDGSGGNTAAATAQVEITDITFDSSASPSTVTITSGAVGGLTLSAASPGNWGNNYVIQIQPRSDDYTRFSLSVVYVDPTTSAQTIVETFPNLSVSSTDSQARYVVNVVNEQSRLVTAAMGTPALTLHNNPSVPTQPTPSTPASIGLNHTSTGNDGTPLTPSTSPTTPGPFETALNSNPSASGGGIHFLDTVSIFNLLCVPGEIVRSTISDLQAYCFKERAFLLVDSESTDTFSSLQNGPVGITGTNAINSAFYFPWINQFDPQLNSTRAFPPCGFVAGLYAATDTSRGVWKAPAGIDASLSGESGLAVQLTDAQNGTLNIQAINCLRNFPVYGDVVWGARTLRGNDQVGSEWKYVPIRRVALFLESSLYDGTQWVVFEPNDETLWGQIRMNIGAFMQGLFLQGAFQGTSPQQAYFVKCDAENNPQSSIDQGIVNILVGFAPLFPAEFVVIQIQQIAGQLQA
jgi:phage tail sheath protein FI